MKPRAILSLFVVLTSLSACSSGEDAAAPPAACAPGCTVITPQQPPSQSEQEAALRKKLDEASKLEAAQLLSAHSVPYEPAPTRDLSMVAGYDLIKKSSLAPDPSAEAALAARSFSLSAAPTFPGFTYGYKTIYLEDLPVYISADSLLYAVHKSYDKALLQLESSSLAPTVKDLLTQMRLRLAHAGAAFLDAEARADIDLFLAVGLGLLTDETVAPVAGASSAETADIIAKARAAQGTMPLRLFGKVRDVDFSQFKPRGHYENELAPYFRAMMWFGRTDLRLIETLPDGSQVFNRRQLDAALGITSLLDAPSQQRFTQVDEAIGAFVGEHDSMTVGDVSSLLTALGVTSAADTRAIDDQTIASTILEGGFGAQRIASQLMINGTRKTLPLHRAFQLFGQRYTLDSHVFSNVVFDRVQGGKVKRMMPSPLDVAYAALGNDQAASLLEAELTRYPYAPDLEAMRILTDEHGEAYWGGSLYTLWLSSLRQLSPAAVRSKGAMVPAFAASEAWGRRLLGAQLSSWAELRHDTLLYAKQSYTGGAACEFTDAYVDPYPGFYAALGRYAERGSQLVAGLDAEGKALPLLRAHYATLQTVASRLGAMAEAELTGKAFDAEQMAFINDAVVIKTDKSGCVDVTVASGWYPRLFMGGSDTALEHDPTIADVHTQPTDEQGNEVGKVLHVGTDGPHTMIVIADTCTGPRAYVGLASSYHELITDNYQRIADSEWVTMQKPPPPPWLSSLSAP